MSLWLGDPPYQWSQTVAATLLEDVGTGDLTVRGLADHRGKFYIEAQADGVVSGLGIASFLLGDDGSSKVKDGDRVKPGDILLCNESSLAHVLTHERTALNFLTLMSGTATSTRALVDAVEGTRARIVDTRKTLPGLRSLQKYAVRCGGGHNHRFGLYDAVMVKDNHIRAFGSISAAVSKLRQSSPHTATIEVECETEDQVHEAVTAGANIIMLDNMGTQDMARLSQMLRGKVLVEASGGINLKTVREVA
ncbi:MAG: carboxylating nicotinate-nucleotide diphosphorylase, partial [Armatimonadota bacterium]